MIVSCLYRIPNVSKKTWVIEKNTQPDNGIANLWDRRGSFRLVYSCVPACWLIFGGELASIFLAFNLEFHFPSGKNAPRGCGEDDEALQVPMQIHWCYHFTTSLWDYTIMAHGMILRWSSLQHLSERSEPNQLFMLKFDIWLHIQMDVPCKPQIWSSVWGSTLRVAMLLWVGSQAYCWVLQGT